MSEVKLMKWQQDVANLVQQKRVVLVSVGRCFGASFAAAHLLMEESRRNRVSVSLTPNHSVNRIILDRLLDQLGDDERYKVHAMLDRVIFPKDLDAYRNRADIILGTANNRVMERALGDSGSGYMSLTVVDSINMMPVEPIVKLIDRHARVVVFAVRHKTSYRSSFFDLWFKQAWKEDAPKHKDWATYQAVITYEDDGVFPDGFMELMRARFGENWRETIREVLDGAF